MKSFFIAVTLIAVSSVAKADFELWKDYELSQEVYSVSTIKVDANMGEDYLEGLAKTWVTGNEVSKKLGHIEDYSIYWSDMPQGGEFNMILVVRFAKTEDLAPNKARYNAFMKEFTKKQADETNEFAQKNYPAMREITGQYSFRKVELK